MVDRARWVDPGMRERGLDQADRLAAHLAQVAVVLVDPAEELQVDAGWRVLDHGPRGRRVLQHAVDVRVGLQRQRLRLADRMRGIDADRDVEASPGVLSSEEHTSELQSLMRTSYAAFCLQKKNTRVH